MSRRGVYPNSFSFDHVGPMTWTVADCAVMLGVIAGHDPADPASADVEIPDYAAFSTKWFGNILKLRQMANIPLSFGQSMTLFAIGTVRTAVSFVLINIVLVIIMRLQRSRRMTA